MTDTMTAPTKPDYRVPRLLKSGVVSVQGLRCGYVICRGPLVLGWESCAYYVKGFTSAGHVAKYFRTLTAAKRYLARMAKTEGA